MEKKLIQIYEVFTRTPSVNLWLYTNDKKNPEHCFGRLLSTAFSCDICSGVLIGWFRNRNNTRLVWYEHFQWFHNQNYRITFVLRIIWLMWSKSIIICTSESDHINQPYAFFCKALHYNFSFGNSLPKWLRNLTKVNKSSLTKIITSFTSFHEFLIKYFNKCRILSFNKTNN